MHDEVTLERSLLYIQQHHVDQFKTIAQEMKEFDEIIQDGGLNVKDAWIIAFTVWLHFLPDKNNIIHSAEKSIYYPANFLLLNALINNPTFKQFKRYQTSPDLIYIASLTLANGINQWIYSIMEKYNLMDSYNRNRDRIYFDAHLGNSEEIQLLAENQARFVKACVIELKTNSYNQTIRNSCNEAIRIYEQFSNSNRNNLYTSTYSRFNNY